MKLNSQFHRIFKTTLCSCRYLAAFLVLFVLALEYDVSAAEDAATFVSLAEDISCGEIRQFTKKSRILGGEKADAGEFPFLASIQKDGVHFCSAFIVKKRVLITAAHCFLETLHGSNSYKDYKILVGSNNWSDTPNSANLFQITHIRMHPKYSYLKPNVENDIALLTIDRPIEWSNKIQPICLASKKLASQEYGVVAGWGVKSQAQRTNMKEWMQDTNLHKVDLPIWTNTECQTEYRKHRINWNTKSSHICAGYKGQEKDTCQGDSGSPLVLFDNAGKRIAYGIVSVGEGCATQLPGIYTRISSFISWIKENS